ncbi:MAG: type I restriction enzyme HsdR N-terminal domain-containing protein [Nitrospinota bacterium]|nr:type I restriction enzyme HsdR N-terminal domain-containing protein [Nitrospinota bacterium]
MDLIDRVKELATKIPNQLEHIQTEEATKTAFVMPFISALGYDVFNPLEVVPEFTADIGTKKGEKVDYAVKKDNKIILLFECKTASSDLNKEHMSQLHRYFSTSDSRFGILTNGINYQFFSDIDEPNKMDSKPFFEFNMLDFEDHHVSELKKFSKSTFSLEDILTTASTLKYLGTIKKILGKELDNPSDSFVRFFASQVYGGRLTSSVMDQFTGIVKDARAQFINEKINERLKSALKASVSSSSSEEENEEVQKPQEYDDGIVTTQEEIEGYLIVKSILREAIDVDRVSMRDTKSYCGILLDNTNRKPICRLHFNSSQKYIGLFKNKQEERIHIENLNDIFNYADRIKAVVVEYENLIDRRPSGEGGSLEPADSL